MEHRFGTLVHRFGPMVQDRQLYLQRTYPELSGGFDIDITQGQLRFRQNGRVTPVQALGVEVVLEVCRRSSRSPITRQRREDSP
ncbi:MAG: hypothetical protein AAGE52_16005 [Myxococcota bacterium]